MASAPNERKVTCYQCGREIVVPAAARTASCPLCYKGIVLDDLAVKDAGSYTGRLVTCGTVTIHSRARTVTRSVEAGKGVHIEGVLEAKVCSGGTITISPGARVKGDCEARSLVVEAGAIIEGGFFRIGAAAESR
ncbi:MAG: polymer-forming cytoskeletal protein [Planctomycetota bacterium]|nr:polymer-forming cytoskeletal protein [Planctomycetota bacterium]